MGIEPPSRGESRGPDYSGMTPQAAYQSAVDYNLAGGNTGRPSGGGFGEGYGRREAPYIDYTSWASIQNNPSASGSAKAPTSTSSSSSSSSSTPPSPGIDSTGVSSPAGTAPNSGTKSEVTAPPTPFLDFEKMFNYQKRINTELDLPMLEKTNAEGYKYRKMEADDTGSRDYMARTHASGLAMQRDVLSSNLERGTMRQQQELATRTKDQDLARSLQIVMGTRK